MNLLSQYQGAGIYVTWDRMSAPDPNPLGGDPLVLDHYRILRSTHRDGTYTSVDTVDIAINEYIDVDSDARIDSFYKIQAENADDEVAITSPPLWGEELLLRASLAYELDAFMRVPVYNEEPIFVNDERTIARVAAWGAWNYMPRPELYISYGVQDGSRESRKLLPQMGIANLDTLIDSDPSASPSAEYEYLGWYPDYNGYIYFVDDAYEPVSINQYDQVWVNYQFQTFSPSEMNDAMVMAAKAIIAQPGVNKSYAITASGLGALPSRWDPAIVFGAAYYLIRRLALSLHQQERRIVFWDPYAEGGSGFSPQDLLNMGKEYKEEFEKMKENIRIEQYPDSHAIITPEYMMPGQRNRFFRYAFKGE